MKRTQRDEFSLNANGLNADRAKRSTLLAVVLAMMGLVGCAAETSLPSESGIDDVASVNEALTSSPGATTLQAESFSGSIGRVLTSHGITGRHANPTEYTPGYLVKANFTPYASYYSQTYRANFRMMIDNNSSDTNEVAVLAAQAAPCGTPSYVIPYTSRRISRGMFTGAFVAQDFPIEFTLPGNVSTANLCVYWERAWMIVDKITVDRSPLTFEAESLPGLTGRVGTYGSYTGRIADVATYSANYLSYGPYTMPVGPGSHTASFYLMIDNNTADDNDVATIDAYSGGRVFATRTIHRKDFNVAHGMQRFDLSFNSGDATNLEFRVYWKDRAWMLVDKVSVQLGPRIIY